MADSRLATSGDKKRCQDCAQMKDVSLGYLLMQQDGKTELFRCKVCSALRRRIPLEPDFLGLLAEALFHGQSWNGLLLCANQMGSIESNSDPTENMVYRGFSLVALGREKEGASLLRRYASERRVSSLRVPRGRLGRVAAPPGVPRERLVGVHWAALQIIKFDYRLKGITHTRNQV